MTADRPLWFGAAILAAAAIVAVALLATVPDRERVTPATTETAFTVTNLPPALSTSASVAAHPARGPAIQLTPAPTTVPTGVWGLPFAPPDLTGCEEMSWYRQQFGLPSRFDRIGYRESRCINADDVHTFCCHSYWQLWIDLHLRDHRLVDLYQACDVDAIDDVNSDVPIDKQRATCAAAALYSVVGASAWSTT